MNKTISINPDLFTFSSSKRSKKKRDNKQITNTDIKVKSHKEKHKKMRKQHILRFLRQKQEENYKKLIEGDKPIHEKPVDNSFNSDFDESLNFLKEVTQNTPQKHNFTSKNLNNVSKPYVSSTLSPIDINTNEIDNENKLHLSKPTILNASTPVWGCLKNGNLPTFRDWKKTTQKSHHLGVLNKHEISAMMKAQVNKPQPKINYIKQRKTVKRNYKVGKSTTISKVAVLISNKTIRNNIMNKTQEIKMKPIEEMKRYLIKRGFIRVGTSAPNDVIRKMYETANLVCGEVENHNADNLLFNYINDVE